VDTAWLIGAGFSQGLIDFAPVDVGGARPDGQRYPGNTYNQSRDAMHDNSLQKNLRSQ
jgi:hypothetical protein